MTGYLYIFKHGIGPGTMPNDVTILKEKDLPNYYTAVWLDRFLTTSELKQYDIPSETRINELLDRIDYCQIDNGDDVVPCDEVNACDKIMASDCRYSAGRIEDDGTEDFYYDTGFNSYEEACDWGINHNCTHIYDREKDEFTPINSCDTKYFANMISASEFNSFDDEYGIHRVSKSDLNYIKDSIYERVSESTDIKFSIDMSITKQLPDAIAKVHVTLRNLDDGTILEYDERVDSNNLEGTIQRMTKFTKALITDNWSEFPDNISDADEEKICGDIYDEIETTIFDYYLYGTPELLTIYSEEDPTFLYNIETDYSDMPDSLTIDIKLEALDRDDLVGLVEDYLKPITSDYNTKYTIEYSKTGRTGKTGYIHIKFQ